MDNDPVCVIEISGELPQSPKAKVGVLETLLRSISETPAEGVMLLLTCCVLLSRNYSPHSASEQDEGLTKSLPMAVKAYEELWANERPHGETLQ